MFIIPDKKRNEEAYNQIQGGNAVAEEEEKKYEEVVEKIKEKNMVSLIELRDPSLPDIIRCCLETLPKIIIIYTFAQLNDTMLKVSVSIMNYF